MSVLQLVLDLFDGHLLDIVVVIVSRFVVDVLHLRLSFLTCFLERLYKLRLFNESAKNAVHLQFFLHGADRHGGDQRQRDTLGHDGRYGRCLSKKIVLWWLSLLSKDKEQR